MKYTVLLHRAEDGVSVSVPGLPGCWSEGETEQEALENIQDAIREYLAAVGLGGTPETACGLIPACALAELVVYAF